MNGSIQNLTDMPLCVAQVKNRSIGISSPLALFHQAPFRPKTAALAAFAAPSPWTASPTLLCTCFLHLRRPWMLCSSTSLPSCRCASTDDVTSGFRQLHSPPSKKKKVKKIYKKNKKNGKGVKDNSHFSCYAWEIGALFAAVSGIVRMSLVL